MIWLKFAKKYLGAYAAKDMETLKEMYSDDVLFQRESMKICGKPNLLAINEQFFGHAQQISIHITNTAYRDKYICIEYNMKYRSTLNFQYDLHLVDIIEIGPDGKIAEIREYER